MIGAISINKVEAALYGKWATNGEIFYSFVEKFLLPQLKPKHIVIMDNYTDGYDRIFLIVNQYIVKIVV